MFDFLKSDWFTLGLEIVFLLFIAYDLKKYFETKKREYLTNIALTIGFFIWAIVPFYNSYMTWEDKEKEAVLSKCQTDKNATLCKCIDEQIFKEYSFDGFKNIDKNSSDFLEFVKETREDCADDSWF